MAIVYMCRVLRDSNRHNSWKVILKLYFRLCVCVCVSVYLKIKYSNFTHDGFFYFERLNLRNTKYKLKYSLDLDCFETKRNVDDVQAIDCSFSQDVIL